MQRAPPAKWKKVLVVDDETTLLSTLRFNLSNEGFDVITAERGDDAVGLARHADLIILDLMLPGLDGFEVCRLIRRETAAPIIILTARTDEIDKVRCLELGADDYVTKPFSTKELVARIRARLRRAEENPRDAHIEIFEGGDIVVDLRRRQAMMAGDVLQLNRREFELLSLLVRRSGRVVTREELLREVWGYDALDQTRTVDVHVGRLRRKIEHDPDEPTRIVTHRGIGYVFNP